VRRGMLERWQGERIMLKSPQMKDAMSEKSID
jgi:hypothetical protein